MQVAVYAILIDRKLAEFGLQARVSACARTVPTSMLMLSQATIGRSGFVWRPRLAPSLHASLRDGVPSPGSLERFDLSTLRPDVEVRGLPCDLTVITSLACPVLARGLCSGEFLTCYALPRLEESLIGL